MNGMSDAKARALMDTYPTFKKLFEASVDDISNIRVNGRRLGPAIATQIRDLYCSNDERKKEKAEKEADGEEDEQEEEEEEEDNEDNEDNEGSWQLVEA